MGRAKARRYASRGRAASGRSADVARCAGGGTTAQRTGGTGTPYTSGEFTRQPTRTEIRMTIKVGDRLPAGSLSEYVEVETAGCPIGPNTFRIEDLTKGRKVVLFGLPGAFTPTCSAKHVPGYVANYDKLKAKGVDEIICMSVNDAFVMGAWARDQKTVGKVRMMGDGSADYTKALGLELDLAAKGLGLRCQRFSMLVDDGVVKTLNIEGPGKFEVSDAETMLKQV
jgi:peroxiredoxin